MITVNRAYILLKTIVKMNRIKLYTCPGDLSNDLMITVKRAYILLKTIIKVNRIKLHTCPSDLSND